MILLQEGMAAGPYVLILLLIVLAGFALVIYVIFLLVKYNRPEREASDITADNNKQEHVGERKENNVIKWGVNVFLIVFLGIVLWGLLSLLKWGCSVKID